MGNRWVKYSEAVMVSVTSGLWVLRFVDSCCTRMEQVGKTEDDQEKVRYLSPGSIAQWLSVNPYTKR